MFLPAEYRCYLGGFCYICLSFNAVSSFVAVIFQNMSENYDFLVSIRWTVSTEPFCSPSHPITKPRIRIDNLFYRTFDLQIEKWLIHYYRRDIGISYQKSQSSIFRFACLKSIKIRLGLVYHNLTACLSTVVLSCPFL